MKRYFAAAAGAALLAGLAGCTSSDADATEAKPAETQTQEEAGEPASVPANDDERVCRAVEADLSVGDKRLDNVEAGDEDRVLRIVEDLEGRLERYPAAKADLKAQVQKVADHYSAAASKLSKPDAYAAQVVKLRTAQTKLLGMCS